jgi:hypothetical protein
MAVELVTLSPLIATDWSVILSSGGHLDLAHPRTRTCVGVEGLLTTRNRLVRTAAISRESLAAARADMNCDRKGL